MDVIHFGNTESDTVLIQMIGNHETSGLDEEIHLITELSGLSDFHLIALKVDNWNDELSPWKAPAVFGDEDFGGNGEAALTYLRDEVIKPLKDDPDKKLYIGGYSLSGLFALWSVYRIEGLAGCAAVSPSIWFPDFIDYMSQEILTDKVYLSLGDKESKTRNPVMSQVADKISEAYEILKGKAEVTLEWNSGNHFKEPYLRTAKGFAWLLTHKNEKENENGRY